MSEILILKKSPLTYRWGEQNVVFLCQKYLVTRLVTRFNTSVLGFVTNMNLIIEVVKNNSK